MALKLTFDNNSLSTTLNSYDRTSELFALMDSRDVTLYVPSEVMSECFSGRSHAHVMARWAHLVSLSHQLGGKKIRYLRPIKAMFRKEAYGRDHRPSVMGTERVYRTYLFDQQGFESLLPSMQQEAERLRLKRVDRKRQDKNFRRAAIERGMSQVELRDSILQYEPNRIPYEMRSMLASDLESFFTRRKFKLAMRKPRYRIIRSAIHLLAISYLTVACSHPDPTLGQMTTLDENNWVDIFIAATAAYSDIFVTDDIRLASLCEHLRTRGALTFRTVGLQAALSLIEAQRPTS